MDAIRGTGRTLLIATTLTLFSWSAWAQQGMDPVPLEPGQPPSPELSKTIEKPRRGGPPTDWIETKETPITLERLLHHVPDPEDSYRNLQELLKEAKAADDKAETRRIERILLMLESTRGKTRVRLSLEEALQRMLAHSYTVQAASYNPAIETTRVVEAESEFDSVFFTSINKANVDQPSASQLTSTDVDQFTSTYGIRKQLQSGTQMSLTYDLDRTKTALSFQQINPEYTSDFNFSLRQPLLRGFGIDFNRAGIMVSQNNERISRWAFHREVRDQMRDVEELYWRLVQARRDVVITARLLAEFEGIYIYLEARKEFDVIPVQLAATRANLEQTRAELVRRWTILANSQDRLLAAINDPELPLGADIEIIPTDFPQVVPIEVDTVAAVQTALEHRPEIKEQELTIENAKVSVNRAQNLELPRLDVSFTTTFSGLSNNADRSFDQMTQNNFISYFVGVEFELPIGNRGPRAAHHRARLQYAQAEAGLRQLFEQIILDVNVSVRELYTTFDQLSPSFESAESRESEVASIVARAERKDFTVLNSELSARSSLASERRAILSSLINYNIAIIDLERAKGTLLDYNNVIIPDAERPEPAVYDATATP